MRLMYWPNESVSGDKSSWQIGARDAFGKLGRQGMLDALEIYPYRQRIHELNDDETFGREALEAIHRFRPDIIFIQHVTASRIPHGFWQKVRRKQTETTLVYHDDDAYGRYVKRIDAQMTDILEVSDLSLISGLGSLQAEFRRRTQGEVCYLPSCFDTARFSVYDPASTQKTHDLIMIGNRGKRKRLPFLYLPGGRRRARLAIKLSAQYEKRFALYGSGWDMLASARGRIPYLEQEKAIQSARVSVNWDHFDSIPYYFSDRLPISLAAGVPHVTSHHLGYEHIFSDCPAFYACKTTGEVIECVEWLLSRSDTELLAEGLQARSWVARNLEATAVFRRALEMSLDARRRKLGRP